MLIHLPSGYHFRKRVPSHIRDVISKNELLLSLGASKRETAKPYACAVYAQTERLFRSVSHIKIEPNESKAFINNELPEDTRELFHLLIEDYHNQISLLKQEATDKSLNALRNQINEMQAFLKPPQAKPSPLFSQASETFLETKTNVKQPVIDDYRATFKRFLEVCGNKLLRDYTGEDAGLFKSLIEQLPETYGKQRNDTRTIQEFVAVANKKNLPVFLANQ